MIEFVESRSALFSGSPDFPQLPFERESWFPPITQKAVCHICVDYTQLWIVNVCKLPSNQSGAHVNQYPACNYWNIVSSQALGFAKGKCREFLECHKVPSKSHTPCSLESYPRATWVFVDDHIKTTVSVSVLSWGERVFFQRPGSGWSWSGEVDALSLPAQLKED